MPSASTIHDVLILGSGPGGLSAALGLCRQVRSAIVFDSGLYRNRYTGHMHNVLTWDHKDPAEFREAAKRNMLERYDTVKFEKAKVVEIKKDDSDSLFRAKDDQGKEWIGRKVILATGVKDIFPDVKGYESVWGRAVFHCLFCHGYEERGGASAGLFVDGMLSAPPMALHGARMVRNLAKSITIYTNGNDATTKSMTELFKPRNITVEPRKIASMEYNESSNDERLIIHFEDGEKRTEAFMLHAPNTQLNGPFVEQLGLEMGDMGVVKTNPPFYETTVKGVFAVGDMATPMKAVMQAATMGGFAAAGVVGQLGASFEGLQDLA